MKNREGDLRTTINNLIMGDEMNDGTVSAAELPLRLRCLKLLFDSAN